MGAKQEEQREAALDLILAGRTNPEVAAELGVSRTTIWRWTREPDFAAELRARRAALRYAVDEVLRGGALRAARYLAELVEDPEAPHTARVRAACALLDRVGAVAVSEPRGPRDRATVAGVEDWADLADEHARAAILNTLAFGA